MRKTIFSAVLVVIILIFCSSVASAQHMGRGMMGQGYGMGPGMTYGGWNRMTPEQQKEWEQMRIEFWKDTLQLRQKLITKQMELYTLWEEDNPDPDKVKDLSYEISDLQSQLLKKRNEFLIQCRRKFGDQGWSCPGGGYGMGPGMMQGGYGMGRGMMGQGYGMGYGMMHGGWDMGPGGMHRGWGMGPQYGPGYQGPQYQQWQKPMEENDVKGLLENYLKSMRNPNLKLGEIEDKGEAFEAEILTKDGSLVDKILVDKRTGWMRSVY